VRSPRPGAPRIIVHSPKTYFGFTAKPPADDSSRLRGNSFEGRKAEGIRSVPVVPSYETSQQTDPNYRASVGFGWLIITTPDGSGDSQTAFDASQPLLTLSSGFGPLGGRCFLHMVVHSDSISAILRPTTLGRALDRTWYVGSGPPKSRGERLYRSPR